MEKVFSLGFIVGRFQMFHLGHASLIQRSLSLADRTVVFVGSATESRTKRNPFIFEERKEMINSVFPQVEILPLADIGVGNVPEWGEYLFDTIHQELNAIPDLYVCGKEDKVDNWFSMERLKGLTIEKVDRSEILISATQLRQMLLQSQKEEWERYVPSPLWDNFERYRAVLLSL